MLPLKLSFGGLTVLCLGSALALGPAVSGCKQAAASDKEEQQKIEQALYKQLQKTGFLKSADRRFELFAKRVVDRKLIDVEFKRPDESGKVFDVVARAREAELRVHLTNRQVLVHMRHCFITSVDPGVATGLVEDKVWPVDLSAFFPKAGK